MTMNLTLITTIVITAAMTSVGTYYSTKSGQHGDNPTTEVATQSSPPQPTPVAVAMNQPLNKPVEIIIKTEIVKKHAKTGNIGRVRDLTQPHYGIVQGN